MLDEHCERKTCTHCCTHIYPSVCFNAQTAPSGALHCISLSIDSLATAGLALRSFISSTAFAAGIAPALQQTHICCIALFLRGLLCLSQRLPLCCPTCQCSQIGSWIETSFAIIHRCIAFGSQLSFDSLNNLHLFSSSQQIYFAEIQWIQQTLMQQSQSCQQVNPIQHLMFQK